jgi:hypothetical protein
LPILSLATAFLFVCVGGGRFAMDRFVKRSVMGTGVWLWSGLALVLGPVSFPVQGVVPCGEGVAGALAEAARSIEHADEAGAERQLRAAFADHPDCAPLAIAFWATTGLLHARHAATRGGPPELLAPVVEAIERLGAWRVQPGAVRDAEYAQSALRAAAAAAQDERPEMQVWITHATELADRLDLVGERPRWPLPASLLAGDLWYEVDRDADAREAYARALDLAPSAYGHRGLARTLNRMRDVPGACAAYRALVAWLEPRLTTGGPGLDEARGYLTSRACPE